MYCIYLIVLFSGLQSYAANPCDTVDILHDLERRYTSYTADTENGETYVCDAFLIPPEGKWYRTNNLTMPTNAPPNLYRCGTKFPIWLNGQHPKNVGESVSVPACVMSFSSNCSRSYNITVHSCPGGEFVYFLQPTVNCDESYCIGEGIVDTAPDFEPGQLKVENHFSKHNFAYSYVHTYNFKCVFNLSTDDLYYYITWYIDDVVKKTALVRNQDFGDSSLTQKEMDIFGVDIKCSVRAKKAPNGSPGRRRVSASQFVGVKVLTQEIIVNDNGTVDGSLQFTVPLDCIYEGSSVSGSYRLQILHQSTNTDNCDGEIVGVEGNCRKSIKCFDSENKILNFTLAWRSGENYQIENVIHYMDLRFSDDSPDKNSVNGLWNRHKKLPSIKVIVRENDKVTNKQCRIINDPHMTTFDGLRYEHHKPGVFSLYKSSQFPSFEVQHQTFECNSKTKAHCTCAVAVRAGADLFVIDYCTDSRRINYVQCTERLLRTEKINEKLYKVFLPTGTNIDIHIQSFERLNAVINPSKFDFNNAKGLCGFLSATCDDDLLLKSGSVIAVNKPCDQQNIRNGTGLDDFIASWKIEQNSDENLFNPGATPSEANLTHAYCTCPPVGAPSESIHFTCHTSYMVYCSTRQPEFTDACMFNESSERKSRSLQIPINLRSRHKHKRQTDMGTIKMTHNESLVFCQNFMQSAPAFSICSEIPEVRTQDFIEMCVLDIELTQSLEWANQTLEQLKSSCMKEIALNNTLKKNGANGEPSIASQLKSLVCPGNPICSSNGECINGTCSCFDGYIGPDCSVDIDTPPVLIGFRGNGLCDTSEISCATSYIFFEDVYDTEGLTCSIGHFKISSNGSFTFYQHSTQKAHHQTLIEITCPLPHRITERSITDENDEDIAFVQGYNISVSYNGKSFSNSELLIVYDSTCQNVIEIDGVKYFSLKEGFCKILDQCIVENQMNFQDKCEYCDPKTSKYSWTKSAGCLSLENNDKNLIIISTVVPILAAIILVIGVIILIKWYNSKRTKINTSQEFGTIAND